MDRTNIFNPFENKGPKDEDVVTRALAVALRYSPTARVAFRDHIRRKMEIALREGCAEQLSGDGAERLWDLLAASSEDPSEATVETQVGSLKSVSSVMCCGGAGSAPFGDREYLILPEHPRQRNAVYDLVMRWGNGVTIIVENKKNERELVNGDKASQQIMPAHKDLGEDFEKDNIFPFALGIAWSEFAGELFRKLNKGLLGPGEHAVVEDLIEYLSSHSPKYSPMLPLSGLEFDKSDMIDLRLQTVLRDMIRDGSEVHVDRHSHGYNYLSGDFSSFSWIILRRGYDDERRPGIWLDVHVGDLMSQARAFYRSSATPEKVLELRDLESKWSLTPNFHVHVQGTHLVWYDSPDDKEGDYLRFFFNSPDRDEYLHQTDPRGLKERLAALEKAECGLILRPEGPGGVREQEESKIFQTQRRRLNIAPGFSFQVFLPYSQAQARDKSIESMELRDWVRERLQELVSRLDENTQAKCREQLILDQGYRE